MTSFVMLDKIEEVSSPLTQIVFFEIFFTKLSQEVSLYKTAIYDRLKIK